jgi:DNA/RNA-binding domain of Phe-tRNA-synthetase-like protein
MSEEIVVIDEKLAENGVKVHMYYVVLNNFDNTIKDYDYSKSVIIPETKQIAEQYTIENVKKDPIIAAYRKFYWNHLNIDPTKIRPSGEALIRRILQGKMLPKISYFVDAYNWGSFSSLIPIGSYDLDTFSTPITIRYAKKGEKYTAIGGKERTMNGNEVLTVGNDKIISQFPYRDADATKITESTKNLIILSMGIETVQKESVRKGITLTLEYLKKGIGNRQTTFIENEIHYISNFSKD